MAAERTTGLEVRISCLCGETAQSLLLASPSLPVNTHVCHCSQCRFVSGQLCISYLRLTGRPTSLQGLTEYQTSTSLTRLHCSTCGAHVFAHVTSHDAFFVASGVVRSDRDVVHVSHHIFVADTGDGGLSSFLQEIDDRKVQSFPQWPGSDQGEGAGWQTNQPLFTSREDRLHGRCHCGGVEYYITPPNKLSENLSSPWPDLLVPYHSGSPDNKGDVKWWLRADNTKFLAGTCTCRSCRLASGFPIQCWAFVPKSNISISEVEPFRFAFGTMRQYESSPGIYREFCSRCGATVFWHCDERPDLIDVSIGLLRAESGVRAEQWLEWATARVSFEEDATDQRLATSLAKGLKRYEELRNT